MKKIIAIFFFLALPVILIHAQQSDDDLIIFDDAEFFFSTEEYEEALFIFLQLNKKHPENHNICFRVGMSYLNIPGKETNAIKYFEKAVENTTLKYKARDFNIKQAPHHSWFYLGNAYRINNELDKALDSYEKFQNIRNFEKNYNLRLVEIEIQATERAKIIQDNPINLFKNNLGENFNTGAKNFQPVVNRKETAMVYMQKQRFYDAIMFSGKVFDEWAVPINITPQIGSDGDMIPAGLSDDGKTLLLVKTTKSGNGDIYISKKGVDFWSKAKKMGKPINSGKDEAHASLSSNGNQILLTSSRRGGYGGLDIYISYKLEDNDWTDPENLGPIINSELDEYSAFLMNDGKTLYFTSKGHFGMGGFDIFFSEKNEIGIWSEPVNIGFPLNTTNDNSFYQPVDDGKSGYIALFNEKENYGEEDIYRVESLPFTATEVPKNGIFERDFTFFLEDEESGEIIEIIYNRKKDIIKIDSNRNKKYTWKLKRQ